MVRALWLLVLVAGCSKHATDDPAACPRVGATVRTVAHADLAARTDLDATARHDAELALGPLESEVANTCRDQKWPLEVRRCVVEAKTGQAIATCAATLTPEQRGTLPQVVKP